MTNVQTAIPFMTVAPTVAGFSPSGAPDAEQAFLAALALAPQHATASSAPTAAGFPAEESPKTEPKPDIRLAEADDCIAKTLLTGSELLLIGMVSEAKVPTQTGTVPMDFRRSSTLALQAPRPSPVTTPGAEIANIWQTESPALPDSAPKPPQRHSFSGPVSTTPQQDAPSGPALLTPEPEPLPANAAFLSNLSAPEEDVATGSAANASAPASTDLAPSPAGHDTDQKHHHPVGFQTPGNVSNIVFSQYVDAVYQSTLPDDPEAGLSPDRPFAAAHIPLPSLPGSAPPVPQTALTKPAPFAALAYLSDRRPADVRVALGPDVVTSCAGPQTTKPGPSGPDISQEESVLRAIWVGSAKDDKPARPVQGLDPVSKYASQDGANAVALPMSRGTPEEASLLPSHHPPSPAHRRDATLAETDLTGPQPGTDHLPPAGATLVSSASERAFPAQSVDPAFVSVSALTERSMASPRLDAPAPPPPQMQIVHAVNGTNEQMTEILLSPEELGHVRIDMRSDGERMVMTVSAERQDTLDLLRRHADQLAAELRAVGQSGVTLSFGRWSGSGSGAAPDGRPQSTPSVPQSDPENLPPPPANFRPAISAAGLYLRI